MKLKDLNVREVLVLKYLACKFLMDSFGQDNSLDKLMCDLARDRLAEKHNIKNPERKTIDDVVLEITEGRTKEEKSDLVSTTYDYVVNKIFTIENSDAHVTYNFFPESLTMRPTDEMIKAMMSYKFNTNTMFVMPADYYREIIKNDDTDIVSRKTMFATSNSSNDEYAIIII